MIDRRKLLIGGVATAGVVGGLGSLWHVRRGADTSSERRILDELTLETGLGDAFDALLKSLVELTDLGPAWLETREPEPVLDELAAVLGQRLAVDAPELAEQLGEAVQRDHRRGDVELVAGWHLSVTECQLAGLRHLAIAQHPGNQAVLERYQRAVSEAQWEEGQIVAVSNWGPRSTVQGEKINEQSDGASALWFSVTGAPRHLQVTIDGQPVRTNVRDEVMTASLGGELQRRILSEPGEYPVALVDKAAGVLQPLGHFTVEPDPDAAEASDEAGFCPITRWGPRTTRADVPANEQADGSMGVWVHTDCLPEQAQVYLGEDRLSLVRTDFGFTVAVPAALVASPGEVALELRLPDGQRQPVGHISVE